jgi:anthranilate 1,2-dioxygenase ferredoxin reductase subunit
VRRGDASGPGFTLLGIGGGGRIALAITVNNGRDMAILRRLIASKDHPSREALADPARKLADLLRAARGL